MSVDRVAECEKCGAEYFATSVSCLCGKCDPDFWYWYREFTKMESPLPSPWTGLCDTDVFPPEEGEEWKTE